MFAIGNLLLLTLAIVPPTIEDLSPLDRNRADFYHAIATEKVDARWELSQPTLAGDREGELRLILTAIANPEEVLAPDLTRLFPDLVQRVQLLDQPQREVQPPATVVIRYRLRALPPAGLVSVPALRFVYYRADFPESLRFQTTYTRSIEWKLTPPEMRPEPTPAEALTAPERFWTLRSPSFEWGWSLGSFAGLYLLVLLGVPAAVWCWRRLFPDLDRQLLSRRNRAARQAYRELQAAVSRPEPVKSIRLAVLGYLQSRFGLAESAQTTPEILHDLREQTQAEVVELEAFLTACDLARFAEQAEDLRALRHSAEQLLQNWESRLAVKPGTRFWPFALLAVLLGSNAAPDHSDAVAAFLAGVAAQQDAQLARPHFRRAAQLWQDSPMSATQAANRLRAWYLAGDLAQALRAAQDGLHLAPWDRELQQDLQVLRDAVNYPLAEPQLKPSLPNELRYRIGPLDLGGLGMLCAFGLSLALMRLLLYRDDLGRIGTVLGLAVMIGHLALSYHLMRPPTPDVRILTQPEVVRSGNGFGYEPRRSTPMPLAAEVREQHRRGNWVLVELPDGTRGWLPANSLL